MFKRLILFLFIANSSLAQSQPIALSADSTIRSIIVKFRATSAMNNPTLIAKLQAVSATSNVLQPVFKMHPVSKGASVQSISVTDTIGLDRIVQITLRNGLSAADAVKSLSSISAFEYVEPNYFYHIQTGQHIPNDPLYYAEWWLENIHAPEAWEITEGDSTIHIGFVDTGVDWLHPDLKFQFAINPLEDINHDGLFEAWPSDSLGINARGDTVTGDIDGIDHDGNGYANDVIGYNFVDEEVVNVGDWSGRGPIPIDQEGHGTAIAGILAAQQDNNTGISGIAPKCKLVALRAFDANGRGEDKDIASAIVYAADNHVQILNMSFGDVVPSLLQRDAIRYALSKGVTLFGSSGNSTYSSTDPNYPSDFDEVVSVGGTTDYPYADALWPSTTHGEEMDIVAPADFIFTTDTSGGYDSVAGTSAASPIAAGIAALLLSKNPNLTPIELRSIIESSTQNVGSPGPENLTANGRVDALAALSYEGSAAIKMITPHTLGEFRVGDTIPITGDAMSTLFTGYSLSWQKIYQKDTIGLDQFGNLGPLVYDSIVGANFGSSNSQVLDSTLGALDTHGFDTGTYTIIFSVASSDNRITEERCNVFMAKAPPKFRLFSVDSIYIAMQPGVPVEEGLVVLATSDIPTQLQVNYAAPGASFSTLADDHISLEHWVMISPEDAQPNVPLTIQAILRSPAGDTSVMADTASIIDLAFSDVGFDEKPYSLPSGFALDSILSLPSGDEVVETPDASGLLTVFTFDSIGKFRAIDSVSDGSLPRAIGNTTGDNKPELLVQLVAGDCNAFNVCGHTGVYKQNATHSLLGNLIYENDTLFGGTFAQLDPDQKQDIVGSIDSAYQAYEYNGSSYSLVGSMVNNTKVDSTNQLNFYSEPNAGHADLLRTGTENLITMDDGADLVVYERDKTAPTGFRAVFIDSNVGISNGAYVATGDFDGDGKPDIVYAFHPNIGHDTLGEYPFAYWTVKVLRNLGGMKFETILNAHFYDGYSMYDPDPRDAYPSSLCRLRNVTGHSVDDLALCFFPNFYLMEFDSNAHAMLPIWHYPLAESSNGAIAWDFDKNGKRELGFFSGDSIHFFEHSDSTEQTPSPAGLEVSPRDTDRVDLQWSTVEGATQYFILRAALQDNDFTLIGSTQSTFYSDTTVSNRDVWIYSVAAFDSSYSIPQSLPAFQDTAFVHPMPRLIGASMQGQNNIYVRTSQQPHTNRIFAGTVMIDDTTMPNAITMSSDSELVLALSNPLTAGDHRMRVTSFGLRDIYNSPFDTADYLEFNVTQDTVQSRFYIVQWTFDQGPNGLQIHVIFNEQPGAGALDVSHYTLSPYGTLMNVNIDPTNANALYIDVSSDVKLVSLGVPFVLCVTGIESITNTPLDAAEGNCAGISLVEPDLSNMMVYPNPAKQSEGQLTFARLTSEADIRIYTINMTFIREITTSASLGGATWDLRDNLGKPVPSGEYLYYATGKNAAGVAVQGQAAKLVIVNDVK